MDENINNNTSDNTNNSKSKSNIFTKILNYHNQTDINFDTDGFSNNYTSN